MKLFSSPNSPFGRKATASAILRGIDGRITRITANPHEATPELLAANPLSKIPCLITDDGMAIFDSPVICEYLDSIGDAPPLFPHSGNARWRALRQQAAADGILDAVLIWRGEKNRAADAARDAVIARQKAAILRALDMLEKDPPHQTPDIGGVSVMAMFGYLGLRLPEVEWRVGRPYLAKWYDAMMKLPAFATTAPS